jgi:superfamily I DNA and RNA helicase
LRGGGSVDDVALKTFESDDQEKSLIRQILDEAKQRGYKPSEITLLSFCSADKSVARQLVKQGMNLQLAQSADRQVGYASVHEFKGMENKVILVTDVNLQMDAHSRSLFFTALTRATAIVRVVCSAGDAPTLKRWIMEGDA